MSSGTVTRQVYGMEVARPRFRCQLERRPLNDASKSHHRQQQRHQQGLKSTRPSPNTVSSGTWASQAKRRISPPAVDLKHHLFGGPGPVKTWCTFDCSRASPWSATSATAFAALSPDRRRPAGLGFAGRRYMQLLAGQGLQPGSSEPRLTSNTNARWHCCQLSDENGCAAGSWMR